MLIQATNGRVSFQFLFFLLISATLWLPHIIAPQPMLLSTDSFVYADLVLYIGQNPLLAAIFAAVLTMIEGMLLFGILRKNHLSKNPMFSAVVYMILLACSSKNMCFHPFILINFLCLISLSELCKLQEKNDTYPIIFNLGFCWSLASLFYMPFIGSFPLLFIIFMLFSLNRWREWAMGFIALLVPYFFMFGYAFLMDTTEGLFLYILSHFRVFTEYTLPEFTFSFFIYAIILLFTLFCIWDCLRKLLDFEAGQRKKVWALAISFVYLLLMYMFFWQSPLTLYPLFIFAAFFLSEWFTKKKSLLAETFFYLWLFSVLIENYILL